ncbi:RICIN domain-containing protein [Streptomyces camelliae]|uniref:RICIN domain-containing protein n=1 Tax=Streptomyces camelliae TaxID=3004093 RepID=A0ABY7PAU2_9ACTN|nr:RICIN domain-containing protein [Streptomyces sp. HUAS 2-6]WBO67711.1 RICIN domain-containing protein [Streptomyces sp. HUAS 2-6]
MQSPYPPRPPYPPLPGPSGESDRELVARLTGPDSARHHSVALLLARHWRAARDYAIVCLAAAGPAAPLVATAAFHQVLARMAGGAVGGALRPQLLVAVRDTVRAWAADDGTCATLPELRRPTGGRGLRATKPGTPERRQLAERAFRALPSASQCLLWHTEVEAEPINIPAGLLGIAPATATAALEQAREQFRAGCVRAHRELAPTKECRFYNRLLDIPMRRGGALLPDVRHHLTLCPYCRRAADTIGRFEGGLDLLLAETVLGWGARRYLDSRPGRGAVEEWPLAPVPEAVRARAGGRHRTGPVGRRRTAVLVGAGLASLALLATVLVVRSWSDDNGVPTPGATWGAPAGHTARPSGTGTSTSAVSAASAGPGGSGDAPGPDGSGGLGGSGGGPVEIAHGSLRALASGRCLDVRGGRAEAGVGLRLAPCSSAVSQQWSYQDDGLLRSAADPSLCLAADPGTRSVVLAGCLVHAGEVAYDITVRGEILLRRTEGLALAPGAGGAADGVGLAPRDGSTGQRWVLEPGGDASGRPDGSSVAPGAAGSPGVPDAAGAGQPGRPQGEGEVGRPGVPEVPGRTGPLGQPGQPGQPGPSGGGDEGGGRDGYEPRIAQVRSDPGQGRTGVVSPGGAVPAVGEVLQQVTDRIAPAPAAEGVLLG